MKRKLGVARRSAPSVSLTATVANGIAHSITKAVAEPKGGTMHTTCQMIFRRLYVTFRDKHVQILRAFIFFCCFAALGFVLFGRHVAAIILVIAIGSAWMLRFETWRWFS